LQHALFTKLSNYAQILKDNAQSEWHVKNTKCDEFCAFQVRTTESGHFGCPASHSQESDSSLRSLTSNGSIADRLQSLSPVQCRPVLYTPLSYTVKESCFIVVVDQQQTEIVHAQK